MYRQRCSPRWRGVRMTPAWWSPRIPRMGASETSSPAPRYDDGGFTGANLERPALERLLADMRAGAIDCVVLYKVDRLSRSLFDFARLMQMFEERGVSFGSVLRAWDHACALKYDTAVPQHDQVGE